MFCIVETVYFLSDESTDVMDVIGPYDTEADAVAMVRSLTALDRENERDGATYTIMPLNMM